MHYQSRLGLMINNDIELYKYLRLLEYIAKVDDVRKIISLVVDHQQNEVDFDVFDQLMTSKIEQTKSSRKNFASESRKIQNQYKFGNINMQDNTHSSSSVKRKISKNK